MNKVSLEDFEGSEFKGLMIRRDLEDHIRFYNSFLSDDEVREIVNNVLEEEY